MTTTCVVGLKKTNKWVSAALLCIGTFSNWFSFASISIFSGRFSFGAATVLQLNIRACPFCKLVGCSLCTFFSSFVDSLCRSCKKDIKLIEGAVDMDYVTDSTNCFSHILQYDGCA
ncbi:unnamed protein product [Linum trigynum]|uniref:Uncharacterized protein n=1 Tax=Linum trigynum TaxID=586398 RepID=A0AAV2C996_9ROSI